MNDGQMLIQQDTKSDKNFDFTIRLYAIVEHICVASSSINRNQRTSKACYVLCFCNFTYFFQEYSNTFARAL